MNSFEAKMKILIDLQDCDTRIREVQRKIEEGPIRIRALKDGLRDVAEEEREGADQLEAIKRKRRQLEQDIDDFETRIEKSKIKLSNIKSNKEYQAALKEIDELGAQKSLSEDRVLELMEEIERLEKRSVILREKRVAMEKEADLEEKKIEKEMEVFQNTLDELEREREHYCQAIDRDLLEKYNFLMKHKGGFAVSPVVRGVCQSCHMGIPPQKFNELKRCDMLMTCPHCSRIIYWGENERFRFVAAESNAGMSE